MIKVRDWNAVAAWFRKAGPMRHKNTPRGGATNQSRDLIDQGMEELRDEEAPSTSKLVDCDGPHCADRRIHHERPDTPRGVQQVRVPQDYTGTAFCSIECSMYWRGQKRIEEEEEGEAKEKRR